MQITHNTFLKNYFHYLSLILSYSNNVGALIRGPRVASHSDKLRLYLIIVARCQVDNITGIVEQGC